jgi:hypothetical protein
VTDHRAPQSRMLPVAVAGLIGVLLGALVVVLGVLAGKSNCCNGPSCCQAVGCETTARPYAPSGRTDHQLVPLPPLWLLPQDEPRRPVPLPGSLMLVAVGAAAWAARG